MCINQSLNLLTGSPQVLCCLLRSCTCPLINKNLNLGLQIYFKPHFKCYTYTQNKCCSDAKNRYLMILPYNSWVHKSKFQFDGCFTEVHPGFVTTFQKTEDWLQNNQHPGIDSSHTFFQNIYPPY